MSQPYKLITTNILILLTPRGPDKLDSIPLLSSEMFETVSVFGLLVEKFPGLTLGDVASNSSKHQIIIPFN